MLFSVLGHACALILLTNTRVCSGQFAQASCVQLVMSSYTFAQKTFTPIPPEKGSFPLDHQGFCKRSMIKYMRCLHDSKNNNTLCRDVAKEYLGCRMDNNLMSREEWSKLGFTDEGKNLTT